MIQFCLLIKVLHFAIVHHNRFHVFGRAKASVGLDAGCEASQIRMHNCVALSGSDVVEPDDSVEVVVELKNLTFFDLCGDCHLSLRGLMCGQPMPTPSIASNMRLFKSIFDISGGEYYLSTLT